MSVFQYSCIEGNKPDLRQAEAVLRKRPDVILFEAPNNTGDPGLAYNAYPPTHKPLAEVRKHQTMLQKAAREAPWVVSDIEVYENIKTLWREGHDVKLYHIDAPSELLRETILHGWNNIERPRRRGVHFPWWVYIYLRERIMANTVERIFKNKRDKDQVVLAFVQKFHWQHVQFLLTHPTKRAVFDYYFGAFDGLTEATISSKVTQVNNPILLKYWQKVSDFR
jgi:hypothetical protein